MSDAKITKRQLSDYQQNPRNPNKAGKKRGAKMIERSFSDLGAGRSLVVGNDDVLIAGNQSQKAALAAGIQDVIEVETDGTALVVVKRTDLASDDPRARQLAYADNRTQEVSFDLDTEILRADVLADLDLRAFYDDADLRALGLADVLPPLDVPTDAGAQVDRAGELQAKWQTARGQVWRIGAHRVMCGDSTSAEDVSLLMGDNAADLCFTSPPYNLGESVALRNGAFRGQAQAYLDDEDNDTPQWLALMTAFMDGVLPLCQTVCVNVQPLAGNKVALVEWLYMYRQHLIDTLIWYKTNPQPAFLDKVVNSAFEFLFLFGASQFPSRAIPTAAFERGTFSNVYTSGNAHNVYAQAGHGATFPLDFALHYITNLSPTGATVLDPFLGSGTTLIACEQTGRVCYAMELQPEYCAVTLQRLADVGLTPELER